MGLKKNIVNNVVLTTSSVFISFITFPYITRTLSATNMGNVLFIDAFTQYFLIFSSLGIPFYGVREIAKLSGKPDEQSKLVVSLVSLQLTLSGFFSAIFFCLGFFIPSLKANTGLVILGCLSIIATSFSIEWFYQGIENFTYITKRSLIIKIISVIAIFVFVKKYNDNYIYYLIIFAVIFLNAALNFGYYLFKFFKTFKDGIEYKAHLRPLIILFSINVSVSVYTIMDTILLGLFTDPRSVSYYSIPLKLVKIIWVVVGGFSVALIPRISKYYSDGNILEASELLKKSLSLVFLITIPFALLCIFFTKEILFTVFGIEYLDAALSLQILSVVPLIIGICNVFGTQFLLPIGLEKKILHATIFGLITSLLLNLLLIPYFKYIGSSIACILAEGVVCVYVYFQAKTKVNIQVDISLLKLIAVTTLISVIVGMISKPYLSNIALLAVLCVTYASVFVALQFGIFKNQFVNYLFKIKPAYNE